MIKAFSKLSLLLLSLLLVGCITTTISPYDDKKDLAKAEQTYVQIGYGYFEQGNMQEAKRALTKALDINAKSAGAHMGLARVYDRELEYDLADHHFKKALQYEETTEGHFQFGVYLYNRGDLKGAYREFKDVLKDTIYVRRARAFEYQGVVANRLEKTDEAIGYFKRAVTLNPMLANSHIGLTNIYFAQQDYVAAYKQYNEFVGLVRAQLSRHSAATLWLGIQLADMAGDSNAVSSLILQLRNQFADSAEYQHYLKWKAEKDAS